MNTDKIVKEARIIMVIGLLVGFVLLGIGIVFNIKDVSIISNNKAIIGLSFIPFAVALIYYLKLWGIKKTPQKMKNIIISESDERLVALKNEADSKAFKITRWSIFLGYMGYTLMIPEDIFEAAGWWILMGLLFITFVSQGVLSAKALKNSKADE